jgi:hypothetical protein
MHTQFALPKNWTCAGIFEQFGECLCFFNLPGETEKFSEILRIVYVPAETRTWSLQNRSPKRYSWKRIFVYVRPVAGLYVRVR